MSWRKKCCQKMCHNWHFTMQMNIFATRNWWAIVLTQINRLCKMFITFLANDIINELSKNWMLVSDMTFNMIWFFEKFWIFQTLMRLFWSLSFKRLNEKTLQNDFLFVLLFNVMLFLSLFRYTEKRRFNLIINLIEFD